MVTILARLDGCIWCNAVVRSDSEEYPEVRRTQPWVVVFAVKVKYFADEFPSPPWGEGGA